LSLADLASFQAMRLHPDPLFPADMTRIIGAIKRRVGWRPSYPRIAVGAGLLVGAFALILLTAALAALAINTGTNRSTPLAALIVFLLIADFFLLCVGPITWLIAWGAAVRRAIRIRRRGWVWLLLISPAPLLLLVALASLPSPTIAPNDPLQAT